MHIRYNGYSSINFTIDRPIIKKKLEIVEDIIALSRILNIDLVDNQNKIKLANFINIITMLARHNRYDTAHINLPPRICLIKYLIKNCGFDPNDYSNSINLIDLCIHTSESQTGGLFGHQLRTASANKIYEIIKQAVPDNQINQIISHKIIDKYFRGNAIDKNDKIRVEEQLTILFDAHEGYENLKNSATKINSLYRGYTVRNKIKEQAKKAKNEFVIDAKTKKLVWNHMRLLNKIIVYSDSAAKVNGVSRDERLKMVLYTKFRQQYSVSARNKNCIKNRIANCTELTHILFNTIYNDSDIAEEIKLQLKVIHLRKPDDHVFLLIGDITDKNSIVIDPWIKYLNLQPKEWFREEKVYASSREVGFMGSKEQYIKFLKSHEDGCYLKKDIKHVFARNKHEDYYEIIADTLHDEQNYYFA